MIDVVCGVMSEEGRPHTRLGERKGILAKSRCSLRACGEVLKSSVAIVLGFFAATAIAGKLSYIQSSGSNYINTGYKHSADDHITCEFRWLADVSNSGTHPQFLFGASDYFTPTGDGKTLSFNNGTMETAQNHSGTISPYAVALVSSTSKRTYYVRGNSKVNSTFPRVDFKDADDANFLPTKNVDYKLDCSGRTATLALADGTSAATANFAATADLGSTSSYPLYIFSCNCRNKVQNYYTKAQLRLFDIRKPSGELNRKLVPWKKADGTVCLYDHVTKSFCGSGMTAGGEGDFYYTLSDEVNPATAVLELRRGTIDDLEILPLYNVLAKMGTETTVNVPAAATNFNSLVLSEGTLSFADGAVVTNQLNGTLTLTGGATLAVDIVGDDCDTFVCGSFALADATKASPAVIRVTGAADRDWSTGVMLISQGVGDDVLAEAIRVVHDGSDGLELGAQIADGKLFLVKFAMPVAHWTGAVDTDITNPDNWAYTNSVGLAERKLPDVNTIVYFSGSSVPVIAGGTFAAQRVEATVKLMGDLDWSGLDGTIPVLGKIDLNGHNLTIAHLTGDCEITDTSAIIYERLDYIGSAGKQYIDTGYQLLKNDAVDVRAYVSSSQANDFPILFGSSPKSGNGNYYFRVSSTLRWKRGTVNKETARPTGFVDDVIDVHAQGQTLTWTTSKGASGTLTTTGTLADSGRNCYVLTENDAVDNIMSYCTSGRLYSFKITSGSTVKRDFVPVRRRSDGVLGLLDLANLGKANEFYVNAGTGAFTAGATKGVIFTRNGSSAEVKPGELHVRVASGDTAIKSTTPTISGAVTLVKEGEGTLVWGGGKLTAANALLVTNGVFKLGVTTANVFGDAGMITVKEQGQFDINYAVQNSNSPVLNRTFLIEGEGPNGLGALVNTAAPKDAWGNYFTDVRLTGDATIGGTSRMDFRNGALDGGGHVFTIKNLECVCFASLGILKNCGEVVLVDGGKLFLGANNSIAGSVGKIVLSNGLLSSNGDNTYEVPVVVEAAGGTLQSDSGAFTLTGTLTVKEGATLTTGTANSCTLTDVVDNGQIEGGGMSATIAGTLSGSGTITGTGIAFGGDNSCWHVVCKAGKQIERVSLESAPTDFLKNLKAIKVERRNGGGSYNLAPALGLEDVSSVALTVTDVVSGKVVKDSVLDIVEGRLLVRLPSGLTIIVR